MMDEEWQVGDQWLTKQAAKNAVNQRRARGRIIPSHEEWIALRGSHLGRLLNKGPGETFYRHGFGTGLGIALDKMFDRSRGGG